MRHVHFLLLRLLIIMSLLSFNLLGQTPVLNEVDADQGATDQAEFIEIYDGGSGYSALDGYYVLLFNGPGYGLTAGYDLQSYQTDSKGFFMLSGQAVTSTGVSHIDLADDSLPDTATIIILYQDPLDMGAIVDINSLDPLQIVDAVVYGVDAADDANLLAFLEAGQSQLNENIYSQSPGHSLQRLMDGAGGARMTDAWETGLKTPNRTNMDVVLINEVDAETIAEDAEFIELYDGGLGMQPLDGLVLLMINGVTDDAYGMVIDLAGKTTDDNGFFLIGSADVSGVDLVLPSSTLQNGADAVALYTGTAADFGLTQFSTDHLVDALVYHTNDVIPIGSALMDLLLIGESMVNEDEYENKYIHSSQRFTDHSGGRRRTGSYVQAMPTPKKSNHATPLINEVDSDQGITDSWEFIEIYDLGRGNTPLDGYFLVLFDGFTDESYYTLDLAGYQTRSDGFFLIGTNQVINTDITISENLLLDGVHAVAIYQGDAAAFPDGTPVTTLDLEDAVVYSLGNPDDAGLLPLIQPGQQQVNENAYGAKDEHSIQRFPDGNGGPRISEYYQPALPTPGLPNSARSNRVLINEIDARTVGANSLEFIELYDGGQGLTSLNGLILVLFDGTGDSSYLTVDLNGYSTDEQGYFLMGTSHVASEFDIQTDIILPDGIFQDGPDAAVLYLGRQEDFPNGTGIVLSQIEDAIVYHTSDSDDPELLTLLNPGQQQVDEDGRGNSGAHSLQRFPNGSGGNQNTSTYTMGLPTPDGPNMEAVLINEVDSDTPGTDQMEFVELFDGGRGNVPLDGLVLVFYNGLDDSPYLVQDLDGYMTDSNGYFVMGNAAVVPAVNLVIPDDTIENGADAIALYNADGTDFSNRVVSQENILDAIVYGTDDATDIGLIPLLNLGEDQVNEAGLGNKDAHSLQRSPNGTGGPRNTSTYIAAVSTPSASNITWSYSTRFTDLNNPGNPGGLNSEADDSIVGWTEITTAGKLTNAWSAIRQIGFDFVYFGNAVTNFKVSQNGLLTFATDETLMQSDATDNIDLTTLDPFNPPFPNLTVCAFWDSFTDAPPTGDNDKVYMKTFGLEPNRQLWIKWASFEYGKPNSSYNYFGIVLEETTNIVYIIDYNWHSAVPISSTVAMYSNPRHFVQFEPETAQPDQIAFLDGTTRSADGNDNDYYEFFPITNLVDIELDLARTVPYPIADINVGDEVTYELTVSNTGQNGATDIVVNLDLSTKVTYLDHSSLGRPFDPFSGNWDVGFLPPNSSTVLSITCRIDDSHEIRHAAEAIGLTGFDIDSVVNNHILLEDDQVEWVETIPDASDLELLISVDKPVPEKGEEVTFTLSLDNFGPDPAHVICVDATLPDGLSYVSDTGGGSLVDGIWSIPLMSQSSPQTLEIVALVDGIGTSLNTIPYTVSVCSDNEYDPNLDNNEATYVLFFRKSIWQATAASGEMQVNQYIPGIQAFPSVDMSAGGNYMITWQSEGGQDGNLSGVYGRPFTFPTTPTDDEILVNFYTANHQRYAQVAVSDSDFSYVVWQDEGQNGLREGIFGMQLDPSHQPVLPGQYPVNSFIYSTHTRADISLDAVGNQVVVWTSSDQDSSGLGVIGRVMDSSNAAVTDEFPVNSAVDNDQKNPRVSCAADGHFVVVWQSQAQDLDGWGVFARIFNSDGTPAGPEIPVNGQTAGNQMNPDVCIGATGEFVVVWQGPQNGSLYGIFARQFDEAGAPLGPEFLVNTNGSALVASPRVDMDPAGNFAIVWYALGVDGDGAGVYGQLFKATGLSEGYEFQVNITTEYDQRFPEIAFNSQGQFVVAWQSYLQDTDDEGVFVRAFEPPCEPLRNPSVWPTPSVLAFVPCVQ